MHKYEQHMDINNGMNVNKGIHSGGNMGIYANMD